LQLAEIAARRPNGTASALRPPAALAGNRAIFAAALLGILLVSASALGIGAAIGLPRTLMARSTYLEAKNSIETDSRAAYGLCHSLEGVSRRVCNAQARGDEHVRKAELEAQYLGTTQAATNVRIAKAKALFEVAAVQCLGRAGEARFECLKVARADKARSLMQARESDT
jgi:hypothetical protein